MIGRIQDVVTASVVIGALEGNSPTAPVAPVDPVKPVSESNGSAVGQQEKKQAEETQQTRGVNSPAVVTDIDELDAAIEAAQKPEAITEETASSMTDQLNELMSK